MLKVKDSPQTAVAVNSQSTIQYSAWVVTSKRVTSYTRRVRMIDASPLEEKKGRKKGSVLSGVRSKSAMKRFRSILDAYDYYQRMYARHMILCTLTLPAYFVGEGLYKKLGVARNRLLTWLRERNIHYIWVMELQKNGNPHYHFLLDLPYNVSLVKEQWLRCLKDMKLLDFYTQKFSSMSYKQYYNYRMSSDANDNIGKLGSKKYKAWCNSVITAWEKGCDCGWTNPNCVDIKYIARDSRRSVYSYVSKYISKSSLANIEGRFYGNSYIFSTIREFKFAVQDMQIQEELSNKFNQDHKAVPCYVAGKFGKFAISYTLYQTRGSVLPYPFRAVYCRFVEVSLASASILFTSRFEDGDDRSLDVSRFNDYASDEVSLMFIFCLWREIDRMAIKKSCGRQSMFLSLRN